MSTSSYPLYMTGNEVAEALRKIINDELTSSGIISIPSTEMDRFDPATLHTPYTCQSIYDGATWTEWAVSGAGGSFGDAAEFSTAETHAIIDPILDGEITVDP